MGRKMKNSAAGVLPQEPPRNTHHHQAKSWVGEILAGFLCLVFGGWIIWYWLGYILREMGYQQPVKILGEAIFWLIICAIAFVAIERIATRFLSVYKEVHQANLDFKAHIATKQLQAKVAEPIADQSTLDEEARKGQIIQQVMARAFQFYDDNGRNYNHRDAKPWSWRQAKMIQVDGKSITETEARKVKEWLQNYQLIEDGNKINLTRYPAMTQVNRLLRREFLRPIMYGNLPQDRDNGYVHIDK